MIYFLFFIFVLYSIYTLRFALRFNKTEGCFTNKQMVWHNILIWVIPFFWIMILKTITSPTPGPQHYKRKTNNGTFYESGLGIWSSSEGHDSDHDAGYGGDGGNGGDAGE